MNLQEFKFPQVDRVSMAFPTFNTIPELLEEAQVRGLDNYNHPYQRLFSTLFFKGGKVKFKNDIDQEFKYNAWSYCRAFMGSYQPKHEHKAAICALILSEICEPEVYES